MFCVIVIVATNAATFYAFPRYVTRTNVLAVPITITTTSMSTTVSTATVISYWTVTMVSTMSWFPYGQYYWWQNPYLPGQFMTTETNWIITQSTITITDDPNPSITMTTQTITTSILTTTTTTTLTATTTSTATTTTSQTTITTTGASYVGTTLSLSYLPTQQGMGSATRFYGRLRERDSGNPVAGKMILLTVMGGGSSWTYSLTTDSNGYYELIYANNNGIFSWAEARFSGDGTYLPSYSGRTQTG